MLPVSLRLVNKINVNYTGAICPHCILLGKQPFLGPLHDPSSVKHISTCSTNHINNATEVTEVMSFKLGMFFNHGFSAFCWTMIFVYGARIVCFVSYGGAHVPTLWWRAYGLAPYVPSIVPKFIGLWEAEENKVFCSKECKEYCFGAVVQNRGGF